MKNDGLKKSLPVSLCILCLTLLLTSPTLESFSGSSFVEATHLAASRLSFDFSEMFAQVNESRLRDYVLCIQAFGPHPTGSQALDALGTYLYSQFSAMNLPVHFDAWQMKKQSGKNIVATLQGTLPTDVVVIICAHYDSLAISPGAEDDGSGVAAVLMIADIMRQYSFNTTVRFILFSGEEQGLLGSRSYATNASANQQNILGVLALDKIGYAATSIEGHSLRHHANLASAWMVALSQSLASRYPDEIGLNVLYLPQDQESDHVSFVEQGYAGSDFVRNATNPFYHTSEDTADHMNFSYLTKVCKLALGTVASMAWFNPRVSNHDLTIKIKGTCLSTPAQFSVAVENTNFTGDSANVTIAVVLRHLFRERYVSTIKQGVYTPCNWTLDKEIAHSWEFAVAGRRFTQGFFTLNVTLTGRGDDLYLYVTCQTFGIILNPFRLMLLPRL